MLIRAIRQIVLFLPRRVALNLGVLLADSVFLFSRREKARALKNLYIAFGEEKKPRDILKICHRCFRHLGKSLMEIMQFPRLNSGNFGRLVTYSGRQNLDDALKMGKGVIVLTAHFGNWELLSAGLAFSGYKANYIVRPVRFQPLDALLNEIRTGVGGRPIPRGASLKHALRCLKRSEPLGILSDIDTRVDGVFVDFFGRPAFTPRGPVILALKTGAALLPTFIVRQEGDKHVIITEKALELESTGDPEEDIRVNMAKFNRFLESYIRKYPEQWIWMHERWRTQPDVVPNAR